MIKLIQDTQKEIEYVIDRMSRNHPLREHLVLANMKIEKLKIIFIDNEVQNDNKHHCF